ncbi:Adenosine monophosphate-protein transferase SoFic [compost metagenome]
MSNLEDIKFRNSAIWVNYSHKRYLPVSDIKYRLQLTEEKWIEVKKKIEWTRFSNAILFDINSMDKLFWYFESDSIRRKLDEVEKIGTQIYDQISTARAMKKDLIADTYMEEAITSAIYEGANTTRARAQEFIEQRHSPRDKAEQMLFNNFTAMKWIRDHQDEEISLNLILKLHEIVTFKTLDDHNLGYSGKFRDDTVYVGSHEGIPHHQIEKALAEVIQLTSNNERYLHPLIRGMILHYFIGYIHPFFDGNGRTARALFYHKALKNKLHYMELLSISAYLKIHGKRYERAYELAKEYPGDMTYFIDFSLDSLLAAIKEVQTKVLFLTAIWSLQQKYDLSDNQIMLLQRLALHKFRIVLIEDYARWIKKTHEMARKELKELAALGLLDETKVGKKSRFMINKKKLEEFLN